MANDVRVLVLRTAGTNCNDETAHAFSHFGAKAEQVHINRLVKKQARLNDYHILALPGGFSYGDDLGAGRILANELRLGLGDDIRQFINDGKLIIGICNGFQILVKAGILPGPIRTGGDHQDVTLTTNDSARFEARWIALKVNGGSVWTRNLPKVIYLPVAHGEGKFVPSNDAVLAKLIKDQRIAFQYCNPDGGTPDYPMNPNGSVGHIAGITDTTGRVLGLMPHPERHFFFTQNPAWTRLKRTGDYGDGAKIFENGVRYVKEHL